MATTRWIGNAQAATQADTITIGTYDAGTTYAVAINSKNVSVRGQGGTTTTTAAALAAALAASTIAEFAEINWSASGATVVATGKTSGVPFIATVSVSGGSGTISIAQTTAATGPNWWSNATNWSSGAVPADGDTVFIENGTVSILYGLAQSAVTLAALNVAASYTGNIGLAQSAGKYQQYRATFLAISATLVNVGYGAGSGSPLIRLDTGTVTTAWSVSQTGSSAETGLPAFCWRSGFASSNTGEVLRGNVGIAVLPGDTAWLWLNVGYLTNKLADSQVWSGPEALIGILTVAGGTVTVYQSPDLNTIVNGGTLTVYGTTDMPCFTINSGTLYWNSTGNLGGGFEGTSIGNGGKLDMSQDMQPKQYLNTAPILCARGATINDPNNVLTGWTGSAVGLITIAPQGCSLDDLTLNYGAGRSVQV